MRKTNCTINEIRFLLASLWRKSGLDYSLVRWKRPPLWIENVQNRRIGRETVNHSLATLRSAPLYSIPLRSFAIVKKAVY